MAKKQNGKEVETAHGLYIRSPSSPETEICALKGKVSQLESKKSALIEKIKKLDRDRLIVLDMVLLEEKDKALAVEAIAFMEKESANIKEERKALKKEKADLEKEKANLKQDREAFEKEKKAHKDDRSASLGSAAWPEKKAAAETSEKDPSIADIVLASGLIAYGVEPRELAELELGSIVRSSPGIEMKKGFLPLPSLIFDLIRGKVASLTSVARFSSQRVFAGISTARFEEALAKAGLQTKKMIPLREGQKEAEAEHEPGKGVESNIMGTAKSVHSKAESGVLGKNPIEGYPSLLEEAKGKAIETSEAYRMLIEIPKKLIILPDSMYRFIIKSRGFYAIYGSEGEKDIKCLVLLKVKKLPGPETCRSMKLFGYTCNSLKPESKEPCSDHFIICRQPGDFHGTATVYAFYDSRRAWELANFDTCAGGFFYTAQSPQGLSELKWYTADLTPVPFGGVADGSLWEKANKLSAKTHHECLLIMGSTKSNMIVKKRANPELEQSKYGNLS